MPSPIVTNAIPRDCQSSDGDHVVAGIHITARGRGSGIEADVRFYAQIKVREGKVAYIYDHGDRGEALEAAGLSE